jgi:hypothetical protein
MTLARLTYQLDEARRVGDRAAITMLIARIRRMQRREVTVCPRCGSEYHLLCNRAPLSELEKRWLWGDR